MWPIDRCLGEDFRRKETRTDGKKNTPKTKEKRTCCVVHRCECSDNKNDNATHNYKTYFYSWLFIDIDINSMDMEFNTAWRQLISLSKHSFDHVLLLFVQPVYKSHWKIKSDERTKLVFTSLEVVAKLVSVLLQVFVHLFYLYLISVFNSLFNFSFIFLFFYLYLFSFYSFFKFYFCFNFNFNFFEFLFYLFFILIFLFYFLIFYSYFILFGFLF